MHWTKNPSTLPVNAILLLVCEDLAKEIVFQVLSGQVEVEVHAFKGNERHSRRKDSVVQGRLPLDLEVSLEGLQIHLN